MQGPAYEGKTNGPAAYVDASAIWNGDRLHVFAVNRSLDESAPLRVQLADRSVVALEGAELVTGPGARAANSFEQPNVIVSRPFAAVQIADRGAETQLPPLSIAAMTFRLG